MSSRCKSCGKQSRNTTNPYFRSDYTPFDYFSCPKCGRCWLEGAHHRHASKAKDAAGPSLRLHKAAASLRAGAGVHRVATRA